MARKSRVTQVTAPGAIRVIEVEVPEVQPPDILVKVEMAGICGTDVHLVHSPRPFPWAEPRYPMALGHESVGRIVEMGAEATRFDSNGKPLKVGDRVVYSFRACGTCYACTILLQPMYCLHNPSKRQVPRIGGAFSDYIYVPEGTPIFRVPDDMPDEVAVLTEPFSGSLRSFQRAAAPGVSDRYQGFGPGMNVVIQGSGTIGVLHTIMARLSGAHKVIVIGAPVARLEACKLFGADLTINFMETTEEERARTIKELTPWGMGPDLVVEAAGAPSAFKEALDLVRRGGTILEFGHFTDRGPIPINPLLMVYKDVTIYGSNGYGPNGYSAAIKVLESYWKQVPFAKIVTHKFGLDDVAKAVETARQQECVKAVVVP
jgi:L-iditol 2-dehydrogenase